MTAAQFEKVAEFVNTMPAISQTVEFTCQSCGHVNTRVLKGMDDFFLVNLSHDNLMNYYQVNFQLMQNFHYSLDEVEYMMPWEREIYLSMLVEHIKEENERNKRQGQS